MTKKAVGSEKNKSRKTAKDDAAREAIAGELKKLIPQLDSEGLAFLVEQARVHLYNMQVEKLNDAADAANAASARASGITKGRKTPKGAERNFRIDGTESGSSYYLHYGNDNVMFSRNEMIHLVKIVNTEGTNLEIRERLYNWFDRERKDFFALAPIMDKFDYRLKTLASLIKKSFKIHG